MNGFVRILYDDHRPKRQSHVVHASIRYDLYLPLAIFTFTFPVTVTSTAIFPQEYHDDLILMIIKVSWSYPLVLTCPRHLHLFFKLHSKTSNRRLSLNRRRIYIYMYILTFLIIVCIKLVYRLLNFHRYRTTQSTDIVRKASKTLPAIWARKPSHDCYAVYHLDAPVVGKLWFLVERPCFVGMMGELDERKLPVFASWAYTWNLASDMLGDHRMPKIHECDRFDQLSDY